MRIEKLGEVGTNAVFVFLLGGDIGSHALWIGFVAFSVGIETGFVLSYMLKKGRLPRPAKLREARALEGHLFVRAARARAVVFG